MAVQWTMKDCSQTFRIECENDAAADALIAMMIENSKVISLCKIVRGEFIWF